MNIKTLVVLQLTIITFYDHIQLSDEKLYEPESSDEVDEPKITKSVVKDDNIDEEPSSNDEVSGKKNDEKSAKCDLVRQITVAQEKTSVCSDYNKHFLSFESYDGDDLYPPWSYRGINGPEVWHLIDPHLFNYISPTGAKSLKDKVPKGAKLNIFFVTLWDF